ncbi:MAG: hypothetical protein GY773_07960, partial [Actinomycetia bacterium]|nr:hypothetical protein [Actinomycetes bacterium]
PATDAAGDGAATEDSDEPLSFPVSRDLRSMPVSATNGNGNTKGEDEPAASAQAEPEAEDQPNQSRGRGRGSRTTSSARGKAPASRPSKRREAAEEEAIEEEVIDEDDKFPWHHQFDDDGPQELKAKSPLLSRAFRSSVG